MDDAQSACLKCGTPLESDDKFCGGCGQPVSPAPQARPGFCQACGSPLPAAAKFCRECGQPTGEAQVQVPSRRPNPPQMPPGAPLQAQPSLGPGKKASLGLLIPGYIFAVLGGFIGLAIGIHIWRGKEKDALGNKYPKYAKASRVQGMIITILSLVMMAIYISMRKG
ncbi:MAG: zinc ribbon domain-containing protein [Proteobacteria bacterium]|nr:zinc ribbon domain-containing protein [Pseudomonadota bacterium]